MGASPTVTGLGGAEAPDSGLGRSDAIPSALLGAVGGAILALFAVNFLFGAQHSMLSGDDPFGHTGAYYVVGKDRFHWFTKDQQNCWGGHTLDGRCISLVSSSGWYGVFDSRTEYDDGWTGDRDAHGFPIASEEAKKKAAACKNNANPLYVEKYGRCP